MIERLIEIFAIITIIVFVFYRLCKFYDKHENKKYKYIFRARNIGNVNRDPILVNDLDDLRKHSMFSHWESYYNLMQSNTSITVKMVKNGHHYNEGIVVGWLEDNIAH